MKIFKCIFARDVSGFYILPLLGYSKINGEKAIWMGFLWWLWTIRWDIKKEEGK